jgi:hypothetical protein
MPQALAVVGQVFQVGPRTRSHRPFSQLLFCNVAPVCRFLLSACRFGAAARARAPLDAWATSRPAPQPRPVELIFFPPARKRRAEKTAMDPGGF